MLYRGMDRAQLDAAYNNSAAVPERDAIVADWAARSAKVRREYTGHLDLAYGNTPRERLDLFLAADRVAHCHDQRLVTWRLSYAVPGNGPCPARCHLQ